MLHSLCAAHRILQRYFDITVFFLNFDPSVSVGIRGFLRKAKVKREKRFGMNCVSIGARWAFWEPGHYAWTLDLWEQQLEGFEYFFVTSGTAIAAHPLVVLNKKFVAWLATSLRGDRVGKGYSLNPVRRLIQIFASSRMLGIEVDILKKASCLLPMSSYTKREFEDLLGKNLDDSVICGYPLDVKVFGAECVNLAASKTCVAVGRWTDPRKDIFTLLSAWREVLKVEPEAKLNLVGPTPSRANLIEFKDLFDSGSAVMHGFVDYQEKLKIIAQSRVGVISSLQEGLCIAGLEFAAMGRPIITTDCGGPEDYVLDSITGFVVPVGDSDAMARRIIRLFRDLKLSTRMGTKAMALVRHFYNQTHVTSIFKDSMVKVWPELKNWFDRVDKKVQVSI